MVLQLLQLIVKKNQLSSNILQILDRVELLLGALRHGFSSVLLCVHTYKVHVLFRVYCVPALNVCCNILLHPLDYSAYMACKL